MSINTEDLEKAIILACQQAWSVEGNTTLNKMIEWILKAILPGLVGEINKQLSSHEKDLNVLLSFMEDMTKDGKDGELPQPKRHPKGQRTNGLAEAR